MVSKIRQDILDNLEDDESVLFADGFDSAIVGLGSQFNTLVVVYDKEKCIKCLIKDGMTEEEAEEYFEYNVVGAYVGEQTPVFIIYKGD